ncbi:MAG TPA: hypothetical protein VJ302_05875 [Blastocatellia bacterium]|nr:hypothetical protein [Blastocatellia bacterium]
MARRIFNRADWAVVEQETTSVQQLFIRERRSLAFQWLFHVRQHATWVAYRHLIESPRDHHPRMTAGFKVVTYYPLFLSLCAILFVMIRWGNPVYADHLASWVVTILKRCSQELPAPVVRLHR